MAKKVYIGVDDVARKVKKIYLGVENFVKRTLPDGYTQVEYIQSSGTQFFETGFTPNQDTRVVMDFDLTAVSSEGWASLFATRTNNSATRAFALFSNSAFSVAYDVYANAFLQPNKSLKGRHLVDKNKNVTTLDGTVISTFTYATFTGDAPLRLLWESSATTQNKYPFIGKLYSCQIYDNGTLVRDFIPCKNESGVVGLYDAVNDVFYTNAGSGDFSVGQTYQGIARKVKKGYIGVGGVARPFWTGGELAYYGTATPIAAGRPENGTTVGDYALMHVANNTAMVAYDKSLTQSIPTALSVSFSGSGAASVGNYALFICGIRVNAYNTSLTRSVLTDLGSTIGTYGIPATTVGDYAIFVSGNSTNNDGKVLYYTVAAAYNSSLTRSTPTAIRPGRRGMSAASVGSYALFGGGANGTTYYSTVDRYNTSLTKGTATSLSVKRNELEGVSFGSYALFGGGYNNGTYYNSVDVYNPSLTRSSADPFSAAISQPSATALEDYVLFGGGTGTSFSGKMVTAYDKNLTKTIPTELSVARTNGPAVTVGNYALFAGGGQSILTVDVYTVS